MSSRLILASASPRRRDLLQGLGVRCEVRPAAVEERARPDETPEALVRRLARDKARHVAATCGTDDVAAVLGADTAVVLDDEVLGKPADADEARAMLAKLAGRSHRVLTGVHLVRPAGDEAGTTGCTHVRFRTYGESTIRWYAASGEPLDKAGAYGIQGRGALLCEGIEGSWSNVVGLPLEALPELFRRVGLELRSFIDP
jgi:septum formation protein